MAREKPKRSMRAAIDAFCKQCIYDPIGGSGTWRQQVEACTAVKCPLYDFRPLPGYRKQKASPAA